IEVDDGTAPAFGDVLELAVTVELVAEEVPEADSLGPDASGDVGERALVDLEEAEIGSVRGEKRGGHARDQVRPGAVVGELDPLPDDLGDHRRRGRLPVRRRDDRRAQGEAGGQFADGARIDGGEDLPRNSGSAAPASAISARRRTEASLRAASSHSNE